MPNVKPGESEKDFVSRCIKYMHDEGTKGRSDKQIIAICYSLYRNKDKKNEELLQKIDTLIK
jgi:hypothetical protein